MRSFVTFDYLPSVRFELSEGITDAEAAHLLAEQPSKVAFQRSRLTDTRRTKTRMHRDDMSLPRPR